MSWCINSEHRLVGVPSLDEYFSNELLENADQAVLSVKDSIITITCTNARLTYQITEDDLQMDRQRAVLLEWVDRLEVTSVPGGPKEYLDGVTKYRKSLYAGSATPTPTHVPSESDAALTLAVSLGHPAAGGSPVALFPDPPLCGKFVTWWNGEYEGNCELRPHQDSPHFDGQSWYDDEGNEVDAPQD